MSGGRWAVSRRRRAPRAQSSKPRAQSPELTAHSPQPTAALPPDATPEELLGAVGAALVLLLDFAEEAGEVLVALLLGVLDVLVVRLRPLQGVVEDAHQVVVDVGGA